MQQLLISTTNNDGQDIAKAALMNRSLLYNKETDCLYIKYDGQLKQLSNMQPDWECTDPNSGSYIKNKPGIEYRITEEELDNIFSEDQIFGEV